MGLICGKVCQAGSSERLPTSLVGAAGWGARPGVAVVLASLVFDCSVRLIFAGWVTA